MFVLNVLFQDAADISENPKDILQHAPSDSRHD